MKNAGLSCRTAGANQYQPRCCYRLIHKQATSQVKDRPRSGRPTKTWNRENRALGRHWTKQSMSNGARSHDWRSDYLSVVRGHVWRMSSVREEGTPGTEDRHVSGSDCNARHSQTSSELVYIHKLQLCLKLQHWGTDNCFWFSKTKPVCVHIRQKRCLHLDPQLFWDKRPISVVKGAKFPEGY